jgi:hypothetical protein
MVLRGIVLVAFAAYYNSLRGPFVFDDASSIVTNPTIRQLWPLTDVLAGPQTNVTAQGRPCSTCRSRSTIRSGASALLATTSATSLSTPWLG